MNLIIDATSKISGGGRIYLDKIYFYAPHQFIKTLDYSSDRIIDCSNKYINKGTLGILFWRIFLREKEFSKIKNKCIFSPFGDYFGNQKPYVSMSQNMLIFEKNERAKFGISLTRLKLKVLNYLQKKSFINSQGIIFISNYAKDYIINKLKIDDHNFVVINHGISSKFFKIPKKQFELDNYSINNPFEILYVSNILPYKNHVETIEAVHQIRKDGIPIKLTIVGKIDSVKYGNKVKRLISQYNSMENEYIFHHENISHFEIKNFYHNADAFIYSSTCENMPNILIEAMSSGLPIVCSKAGPMKEFLKNAGYFFDSNSIPNIKKQIIQMLKNKNDREEKCKSSYNLSKAYSWKNCSDQTFTYLNQIFVNFNYVQK